MKAQAVGTFTGAGRVPGGGARGEVALTQPNVMLMAGAWRDRLRLHVTANLEGATMRGGELSVGSYGEGFIDRRHPHTVGHELMAAIRTSADARLAASVAAGKGFVPFGTDDPMVRPFVRFPVNHHLAQVLERAVAIVAVRAGPVALEGALFNGDEPETPWQWPSLRRVGDSWSLRATVLPQSWLEAQGSYASVRSPEHRPGAGNDQDKWSASLRSTRALRGLPLYVLAELAHTSEAGGIFGYTSLLAEAALDVGRHRMALRAERTDRPEDGRTNDPFRTPRPKFDGSTLGETRWTLLSVHYSLAAWQGPVATSLRPIVELTRASFRPIGGGLFDADALYGGRAGWHLTVGLKGALGGPMHRMGRYGVLAAPSHDGREINEDER